MTGDLPTTVLRRPRRPRPGAGAIAVAAVLAALAGVVTFPEILGVDDRTPFVQVVAFRPQLAAGLVTLAVLVAVLGRGARPAAVALGLVGLVGLAVVLPRAVADAPPPGAGDLSILTASTYLGDADADGLAATVRDRTPDVVVLPEAGGDLRRQLLRALDDDQGGAGYRSYVADARTDDSPMTVLVRRTLGRPEATVDRSTEFPSVIVDLTDVGGSPVRVVATHPQSPRPGETDSWRRDVAALSRWCDDGRATVVAGDLNATLDHAELRDAVDGCTDVAAAVGEGLVGTWPATLPRLLGVQIDHVLVAGGPRPVSLDVVDVEGSDHRGLLARVRVG